FPRLDAPGQQRLEQMILSFSIYRDGIELSDEQREWDREARLRLLTSIPEEQMSAAVSALVHREKPSLPHWNAAALGRSRAGHVREIPPISKDEMAVASSDEVVNAIRAAATAAKSYQQMVPTEGGWERLGGPRSAAPELTELAKLNPG